jgi:anti-anti-sigma factor
MDRVTAVDKSRFHDSSPNARTLQICTIFFRSIALICRFWGTSFVNRVNGQSTRDKMDQCRVLQENRPRTHGLPSHEGVMPLQIKIEQAADVAVLQCVGRLVRGEPLHFLKQAVIGLKQPRIVVLDLSGVETVDGGGLGMLVFLHSWTRENAIQLKLTNPSGLVRYVLECTRLTRVLTISSMEDAVEILASSGSTIENRNWAAA